MQTQACVGGNDVLTQLRDLANAPGMTLSLVTVDARCASFADGTRAGHTTEQADVEQDYVQAMWLGVPTLPEACTPRKATGMDQC